LTYARYDPPAPLAEPQQNTDNKPLSYRLGWDDLSQECADDVIGIVRECLRNVVKHATATAVWVRLPAATDGML
jgi:signal transduction histidine kinase